KLPLPPLPPTTCSTAMSWSGWTWFQMAVGIALQRFSRVSFCRGVSYQSSNDSCVGGDTNTTRVWSRQLACNHQFDGTVPFRLFSTSIWNVRSTAIAGVFTASSIIASRVEVGVSRRFMGPSPSAQLLLICHPPRRDSNDELQCHLLRIFIGNTVRLSPHTRPRPLG